MDGVKTWERYANHLLDTDRILHWDKTKMKSNKTQHKHNVTTGETGRLSFHCSYWCLSTWHDPSWHTDRGCIILCRAEEEQHIISQDGCLGAPEHPSLAHLPYIHISCTCNLPPLHTHTHTHTCKWIHSKELPNWITSQPHSPRPRLHGLLQANLDQVFGWMCVVCRHFDLLYNLQLFDWCSNGLSIWLCSNYHHTHNTHTYNAHTRTHTHTSAQSLTHTMFFKSIEAKYLRTGLSICPLSSP